MRNVSLERGRIWLRYGPRDVLLAEALFEVLKLLRKVDARMEIIEDSTWNIESEKYYWSCFQLSSNKRKEKFSLTHLMADMVLDHVGLAETSRHWTSLSDENRIPQILRGHFMSQKLDTITTWNEDYPFLGLFQNRGTAYLPTGKLLVRNTGLVRDPSGLGIWAWKRFRGQRNSSLHIANLYRNVPPAHGGVTVSIFYQHLTYFRNIMIRICPRQSFMIDIE